MKSERTSQTKLVHAAKLFASGKITEAEFGRLATPLMRDIEDTKRQKRVLREIDAKYGKKASAVVQGGLPSLGKHQ
jgi:hypothetical protein